MEFNFPHDAQTTDLSLDWEREQQAEADYRREMYAAPEFESAAEEMEAFDPTCECGHLKSEHRKGMAYGLETYHCDVYGCGCPEVSYRIQAKPVKFATSMQGNLFEKGEVA